MKKSLKLGLLAMGACLSLMSAAPAAHAETHGHHGRGTKYYNYHNDHDEPDGHYYGNRAPRYPDRWVQIPHTRPGVVIINNNDRVIIRNYMHDRWRPVHVTYGPRYLIGAPLPYDIDYYPVPYTVLTRLQPIPRGYEYVRVDNDVLLISQATKMVIDAVTLLAATR